MNRNAIPTLLAGWFALCAAPGWAFAPPADPDANLPPFITNAEWKIIPFPGSIPANATFDSLQDFNPNVDVAQELDILLVRLTITDPDWGGEENEQEGVYIRMRSIWSPVARYPSPEPPPIPEADEEFQPEEGDGLAPPEGATQLTQILRLSIPPFVGTNQGRLRGVINFDVRWLVEFAVSNEQSPECLTQDDQTPTGEDTFFREIFCGSGGECEGEVTFWCQDIAAKENPALPPPNSRPFADAGFDQVVEVGSTVVLDGSGTFDSFNLGFNPSSDNIFQADALTYAWEWISGPERVDPVQLRPNDPEATVLLEELGTYVYRLTVDDNVNALPTTDSVTIQVVAEIPDNRGPRALIRGPQAPVVVGEVVTLDGSGSSDPDGDPLTFRWRQTNEVGGDLDAEDVDRFFQALSGSNSSTLSFQARGAGEVFFRLLVSDGQLMDARMISVQIVEPATAGVTAGTNVPLADEPGAVFAFERPERSTPNMLLPACGAGALPLALVPLALGLLRGRIR